MKEIKVQLYRNENDSYVELWKTLEPVNGKPKYYGRYTYADLGTWYYVCDPLGYCELDSQVKDDIMFIICDENGNECVRYSNADENPIPKFSTYMKKKWEEFSKNIEHNVENYTLNFWSEALTGETTYSINQWLLTFKDPDLYKKEIDDMYGYDENWTSRTKEIAYKPIPGTEFEYLGHRYQFTRVTCEHEICGVRYFEFLCTDSPYTMEDMPWIKNKTYVRNYGYQGNWFDPTNVGKMLDKRSARKLVIDKLKKLYPQTEKSYERKMLYVDGNYCYEKSYGDIAEALIGKDLQKSKVLELVDNLKEVTEDIVFVNTRENKQKIKEKYPGIYDYDWCLL